MSQADDWGMLTEPPATPAEQATRTNDSLNALMTLHRGAARPDYLTEGLWINDSGGATAWILYFYDGANDIQVGTINSTANTFTLYQPAALADMPGGRLTLTSGTPVTNSDVTAATAVYYTPFLSNTVPIYDGSIITNTEFSQLTLTLNTSDNLAGTLYDVFLWDDSGTMRIGTGPAWSNSTPGSASRGTGAGTTQVTIQEGHYRNTVSITLKNNGSSYTSIAAGKALLLGTIYCSANGQVEDSLAKRFLSNAYNQVAKPMVALDGTNSWTYSTDSFRQANNNAANQLNFVQSIYYHGQKAAATATAQNSTSTARNISTGIGLNTTSSASSGTRSVVQCDNGSLSPSVANWFGYAPIGVNYLAWLERGGGSDTQTWYGDGGGNNQSGIVGEVFV